MFSKRGFEFGRFFNPGSRVMSLASKRVVTCKDTDSIEFVSALMAGGFRKLPVISNGEFAGIVTLNDVLDYCGAGDMYQEFLKKKQPLQESVGTIMDTRVATIDSTLSLKKTWEVFKEFGRGSYPVLDGRKVVGMVSDWDLLKNITGNIGIPVEKLMVRKPAQARESYPLLDVAKIMVKGGYRRLPVTKWNILTGIVVPSDILAFLRTEGLDGLRSEKRTVSHFMKRDVTSIDPRDDIGSAVRKMLASRLGGLPVTEEETLIGIITESDIVQGLL